MLFASVAAAQPLKPVEWKFVVENISNDGFVLKIKANIAKDWYVYAEEMPDGGPLPMIIAFDEKSDEQANKPLYRITPYSTMYDDVFDINVNYYENTVIFARDFTIDANRIDVMMTLEVQACYKPDGQCVLITDEVIMKIEKGDNTWGITEIKRIK